jgi:hypothetical protein
MKTRLLLPLALAGALAAERGTSQTVKTVASNGPPTELYDIVILGDGYRLSEQALFDQDVNDLVAYFRNSADKFPYGAYFNLYNVHSVFRASAESGADKPPLNFFVDTAYDATYWYGGTERCLYIGDTSRAARDAALAPDTDGRVIVLVNDPKYGGCAGTYSVGYNGSQGLDVQAHEWGHSFGALADEYADLSGTYPGPEPAAANCTKSPTGSKWQLWLGFPGQYSTVGAFQGASRYPLGIWRPESNCEMRALNLRFCTICREQLIKRFHQETVVLGSPTPASPVAAAKYSRVTFSFQNRIATRPHTIEWRLDAGPFVPGTGSYLWDVGDAALGPHSVTVRLRDTSAQVRNDPTSLLTHTHSWTVNVGAAQATHATFGAGCPGSAGVPALAAAAGGLPWIGETFHLQLTRLPPGGVAVLLLGSSRTAWGSLALPFDLSPLGMTGCTLLVSGDGLRSVQAGTGTATVPLPICDCPDLVGGTFFSQAIVVDPAANPFGATATNAGMGRIGAR